MWYMYQILCIALLLLTAGAGDYVLEHSRNQVYKAFADNSAHALIGLLSWLLVSWNIRYTHGLYKLTDSLLCMIIASLIDLDHFCAAKSIHLRDALTLPQRPILHLTTIPIVSTVLLLGWAHWTHSLYLERLALIIFVAFGTHHTRDAHRRGYWIAPFGSTPPLSCFMYLFITILIPYCVVLWLKCFRMSNVTFTERQIYGEIEL